MFLVQRNPEVDFSGTDSVTVDSGGEGNNRVVFKISQNISEMINLRGRDGGE